ncbi:MAG: hypothetical protein L0Y76_06810, partial [Ignavibacteria bacterium]|nr:hypothetical protein [Ignavibacteria bacterium]
VTETVKADKKDYKKPDGRNRSRDAVSGGRPAGKRKFGGKPGTSDKKFGKKNFGKTGEKRWSNDKAWRNDKPDNEKSGNDNRKPGEKKWSERPWRNDKPFGDRRRSDRPGFSKNKFGGKKKFGHPGESVKKKVYDVYKASDDGKSFNKEIYNREEDLYTYARSQERGKKGFDKSQLYKHIEPGAFSGIKKSHTPNKNFKKKFNPANKNKRKFF